jgi:hypothetical protein
VRVKKRRLRIAPEIPPQTKLTVITTMTGIEHCRKRNFTAMVPMFWIITVIRRRVMTRIIPPEKMVL